ncbi:type VI secretion system Vgr family protein [Acinetobacter ihumii]|uniref:type VI secretion system Vgr family protein n=1 Tax=Acinetobacter ihumii TaxID=2483802 RepID=UPI00102F9E76|nr:type VI secretion system Vgr family protein [Acinetobacter ihumii]
MLNHIFGILDQLGFNQQKRAISFQFSNQELNHQVMLQRIDGYHAMNEGLSAELICLSTNPYIPLKQFIGCQVAVDQVTDTGQLYRTTGMITGASQGQSDGALSLYRITLQDATSLWHKRRNSRVFMNKSAIEIIEIIFKEWQNKSPLFAASLKLDSSGLNKDYDIRPFSMQSNESDYAYLTRLMREESINWLIDEDHYLVAAQGQKIQAQKLRLIDDNSHFQALQRRTIRYHRSNATEQQDSITSFIAQRQLQPTAIYVQRWQADSLSQEDASGSVLSTHQHSQQRDNESLSLEQAWNMSPAWITDLNGEDQATASGNSQLEKLNKQLNQYQALQAKSFIAYSSVRDIQVGYWFQLIDHPELEKNHSQNDKEFLILSKRFYNQNNLPKDIHNQVEQLLKLSHWQSSKDSQQERQANELTLVRRSIDIVPEYDPLQHRATAHVQRARVVGAEGEEIHVDEWGRIKVRFLFTRNEDHQHDGGAGSNDSDTDSAWVDVLTPWAGEGYGARFLPRVGEIVVIDFFDGNIDRPFVTGRIHEAQRSPTKFDIKGQLPDTKKLSGIRSKEIGGEGYNQLRFDDTTGQISAQLHSSHGATQLNLGNLSHPKERATSEGRGEGFELRTDQWGAVRAGKGLYLTTHRQEQAQGQHLKATEAQQQIEGNLNNAKALSEVAKNQQTDPLDVLENIQAFLKDLEIEHPEKAVDFKTAVMLLASPQSIAMSSNADIYVSANGQFSQHAGESINLSTQKSMIAHAQEKISLFAAQQGARLYAGKGKVEIQAQGDGIDLIARKDVKIISTEDKVEISSPKEIVITSGGSQIKINSSGVFPTTSGKFEVKAGQHLFVGGAQVNAQLPALPKFDNKNWIALEHLDVDQEPFANLGYKIFFENNQTIEGRLDEHGKAHHENVPEKAIRVEYEQPKMEEDKPWDRFDTVMAELNKIDKNKGQF